MKVIGIIAEYNPFHNGHAYQIAEIRKRTGADYIVVAMSGDFVQRGTPAIIDKYTRTNMALSCGADLILELPTLWATASAEDFAMAGVTLFDKMGCVDGICFGAETDNLDLLSSLADILANEPEDYRELLSSYIKEGLTFPAARAKALVNHLTASSRADELCKADAQISTEAISSIINEPNNILAIEYLKALKRRHSSLKPYLIKREGAGYHDATIYDNMTALDSTQAQDSTQAPDFTQAQDFAQVPTASATAIRKLLLPTQEGNAQTSCSEGNAQTSYSEGNAQTSCSKSNAQTSCAEDSNTATLQDKALPDLSTAMPDAARHLLSNYLQKSPALCAEDFSQILGYQLLTVTPDILAKISGCNTDIANRLYRNRQTFYSYERFVEQNKSKDVTYTRVSRILIHLLLGISQEKEAIGKANDYIPYLRILGFRKTSGVLAALKQNASVPIISKLADAKNRLPAQALSMLEDDIFAADLYEQIKYQRQQQNPSTYQDTAAAQNEYTRGLVLL